MRWTDDEGPVKVVDFCLSVDSVIYTDVKYRLCNIYPGEFGMGDAGSES